MIVLLLIGVFILGWSMNRHLKKLPKSFDAEPETVTEIEDAAGESQADAESGKPTRESSG